MTTNRFTTGARARLRKSREYYGPRSVAPRRAAIRQDVGACRKTTPALSRGRVSLDLLLAVLCVLLSAWAWTFVAESCNRVDAEGVAHWELEAPEAPLPALADTLLVGPVEAKPRVVTGTAKPAREAFHGRGEE